MHYRWPDHYRPTGLKLDAILRERIRDNFPLIVDAVRALELEVVRASDAKTALDVQRYFADYLLMVAVLKNVAPLEFFSTLQRRIALGFENVRQRVSVVPMFASWTQNHPELAPEFLHFRDDALARARKLPRQSPLRARLLAKCHSPVIQALEQLAGSRS